MAEDLLARSMEFALNKGCYGAVPKLLDCRKREVVEPIELIAALAEVNFPFDQPALEPFFDAGLDPTDVFVRFCNLKLLGRIAMMQPNFRAEEALRRLVETRPVTLPRVADLSTFVQLLPARVRDEVFLYFSICDGTVSQQTATALISGGASLNTPSGRRAVCNAIIRPEKRDLAMVAISNCPDLETPFADDGYSETDIFSSPLVVAIRTGSPTLYQQVANRLSRKAINELFDKLPPCPERDIVSGLIENRDRTDRLRDASAT